MHLHEIRLKVLIEALPEKYQERFRELYMGCPTKGGYGSQFTGVLVHAALDDAAERGTSSTEMLAFLVMALDEHMVLMEKYVEQLVQNQTFSGFTVR